MALNLLGMEVLIILIATQGDNSASPQVIQPSEFFPYANSVPMVYLSSYLRFIFSPPAAGSNDSTTPPPTDVAKLLAWLNPLLADPLPPSTPLCVIFQNIRVIWCNDANDSLATQQRTDLRDILSRYASVRDLELFANVTIGADETPLFDAYDIAQYFYAESPLSSSGGLAAKDKARLLVDLVLITNGTDACVGFLAAGELARLLFRNILPPRWDEAVKDEVVAAMVYLATSNLTSQDITAIVDNFVKDSFLQDVPPYELIRFIVTFLSNDARRPLCSALRHYGALRCNNVTMKDLGRLCVELDHYASTSEYYGVKVFSRLIAASLDCGNQTIPTTPSPTTPSPPPNDIAVLRLNTTIDLHRPCAKPICLDPTFQVQYGQKCQVAGWGITQVGDVFGSDILQTISISTYQGSDCLTLFPNAFLSDPTKQLCAGEVEGKIDSCTGDSGGPLLCFDQTKKRWVAAGVVSYGDVDCARPGSPGVYGNVGDYYDWIQQKLIQ
ncbi:unnamed protein product [Lymnaea stagnalis]|uniref:Peptidase S1 domain-containing protein n=1 Tax=Lymnaea stagnalis TaxID=6523 RepID=A0AAV2HP35_LYMST